MSTSIKLTPLGTSTIKYVKNGTTTDITEVKYKKGSSGTATTVWTKSDLPPLPASQEIACNFQVSDLGESYRIQMTFSKNSSLAGGSISPTVTGSGTRLLSGSDKLAYMVPTFLSFETSTAAKTLVTDVNKTDVHSSGFTISYNDPTAGEVSYTGNFPMTVLTDYQNECPWIERIETEWVDISGAEGTHIDTEVAGASSYSIYVTLSYYDSDGNFLGTSDRTEILTGNYAIISKDITGWYGGKSLIIKIHTLEYTSSTSNIYMIDMSEEDPQFYEECINVTTTCTTNQKLIAPSVSLEIEHDYDDTGDGNFRTNNNLLITITNNNYQYGYVTFSTESDIGTFSSHFTESGPSKAIAAYGSATLRHSDILDNTSACTRVTYSKAGFVGGGGITTATVGAWDDSATS